MITMTPFQRAFDNLTDDQLRFATLAGFASIPLTIILSARSELYIIVGTPLLFSGLVVGYIYSNRSTENRRAGKQTGLVGSIGVVIYQIYYICFIILSGLLGITIGTILAPVVIIIGVGLSVLIGMAGATIGDWLAKKFSHVRSTSSS